MIPYFAKVVEMKFYSFIKGLGKAVIHEKYFRLKSTYMMSYLYPFFYPFIFNPDGGNFCVMKVPYTDRRVKPTAF